MSPYNKFINSGEGCIHSCVRQYLRFLRERRKFSHNIRMGPGGSLVPQPITRQASTGHCSVYIASCGSASVTPQSVTARVAHEGHQNELDGYPGKLNLASLY